MGEPTILVAIDFSKESEAALLWAVDHATRANAQLAIIHAIHDPADAPGFYKRKQKDQLRPTSEVAQELLDNFLLEIAKTRPENEALATAKIILVKGLPAKRILTVATEMDVDHIVMGCFGHRHLSNILMGSVAQQVVRKTALPVTLVKSDTN
jgi:nucleotide-binding universal stress UspA family protein